MRVTFRPQARSDFRTIFRIVLDRSQDVSTARRFTQRIKDRCERIGDAPYAGRPRDDLEVGLRTIAFERSAVIAYTIDQGRVRIANIFYRGRDITRFYDSEETGESVP